MTKTTKLVIVTIGIWASGIGSAAALVTTLARKPVAPPATEVAHAAVAHDPEPDVEHFKVPKPLEFVSAPKVRSQLRLPSKKAKTMRCGEYKPLQIGPVDRGVRYCQ
jgi:hypothetical protein